MECIFSFRKEQTSQHVSTTRQGESWSSGYACTGEWLETSEAPDVENQSLLCVVGGVRIMEKYLSGIWDFVGLRQSYMQLTELVENMWLYST